MSNDEILEPHSTATRRGILKMGGLAALGSAVAGSIVNSATAEASPVARSAAVTAKAGDFQLSNRFSFEIDGVLIAGIHTLDIESDSSVPNDPTSPSINTLTVTKDWSNTSEWFAWRKSVLDGKVERRTVTVRFRNASGVETSHLTFLGCWPSKLEGPAMDASKTTHAQCRLVLSWNTANN